MSLKEISHTNKKIKEWTSKSKIEFEKVRDRFAEPRTVKQIDDLLYFFETHSQYLIDFFKECETKGESILTTENFPPKYQTIGIKDGKIIKGKPIKL
jgi:hypothetical protein